MHPPAEQLVRNHDVEQEDEHSGIHSAARAAGGDPGGSTSHALSPGPGGKEQNGSAGHLQEDHRGLRILCTNRSLRIVAVDDRTSRMRTTDRLQIFGVPENHLHFALCLAAADRGLRRMLP